MDTFARKLFFILAIGLFLAIIPAAVYAARTSPNAETPSATPVQPPSPGKPLQPAQVPCDLLDDARARGKMSAMFETRLLIACGRAEELGQVTSEPGELLAPFAPGADVLVNNPAGDAGGYSHTQSETSIAVNENTGTICSGYNDSYHGVVQGQGYTGFSRSTDGGASFTDGGALSANSYGDPSVVWRRSDGYFYFAALHTNGLGLWRSTNDCQSFSFVGMIHSGSGDDKELMAVDNNPSSPHYGRIYVAWTDFAAGARIRLTYSDNATSWSAPIYLSAAGVDVQGAWPTVAPNGDVYVGWVRWNPYYSGPIDIEIVRSTDGGNSASFITNPMSGQVNPRMASATSSCGRPALNGNIRYLPSPQLIVGPDGCLHVIYTYDPDGYNSGDVINVYYRRSCDNGATWGPEIQLNDDGTLTDQFFPAISVSANNVVATSWYDRRLDPSGNYLFDYFTRTSNDGGNTWQPSTRVSDVSSPVYLDPNLATCYHGDYDQQAQYNGAVYLQWSDDRNVQDGHNDPDVWFDKQFLLPDFTLSASPTTQEVCLPQGTRYTITVGQIMGYNQPVTLSVSGQPAGTRTRFRTNPVIPPGTTPLLVRTRSTTPPGNYVLTITGTSPDATHSTTVNLNLYSSAPSAVTLVSPADGAVGVDLAPAFEWSATAQAASYLLEVATDASFTNIVYSATVNATSHTSTSSLNPETLYYWRVRAENACGPGAYSATFSFTTRPVPPILLVDDDDNAPDVRAYYTDALNSLGFSYDIWDTANSDAEPDAATLSAYSAVIWFTGDEFGGFAGPGASGEAALGSYLDGGGCLLISSQDYVYDRGLTAFMSTYLGVASATSDVSQTRVRGQGSVFGGLGPYTLSYPFTNYSDVLSPDGTAELAFAGNQGNAAVDKAGSAYKTAFLGFPLEAIANVSDRATTVSRFTTWCGIVP